jgi:ATP-dependent protease ClpP protease subunit
MALVVAQGGHVQDISKERTFHLIDEIADPLLVRFADWLQTCYCADRSSPIKLVVTSHGGMSAVATAMCELLRSVYPVPMYSIAVGYVASAAVPVYLAGTTRYVTAKTELMVHSIARRMEQGRTVPLTEFARMAERLDDHQREYAEYLLERCDGKLPVALLDEWFRSERHITAAEAMQYGFAHHMLM